MQPKSFYQEISPVAMANFIPTKSQQSYFLVSCASGVMGIAAGVRVWVIGEVGDECLVVIVDEGL